MSDNGGPCIVCKSIDTVGGLERYIVELAAMLDAPIYTPIQTQSLPDSWMSMQPTVQGFREMGLIRTALDLLPLGSVVDVLEFEAFDVPSRYDTVITVGEPAKSVVHQPEQRRIHLLNMPPRWLFDLGPSRYDDTSSPVRWLKRCYQSLVRVHDVTTVSRIDEFVVPSETIARRLETYYNRTAERVIYPPVDLNRYRFESNDGYLLYLGRLAPIKRVVELVEALSATEYRLKVAGTGPLEDEVRHIAGPNVDVLGYVSEERKRNLLANCDALVFNSDREAFGIVPIEAMASGKPVVGIAEGFTEHQIRDGENGVLFERGPASLLAAIERAYSIDWSPNAIQRTAERYGVDRFRDDWCEFLST